HRSSCFGEGGYGVRRFAVRRLTSLTANTITANRLVHSMLSRGDEVPHPAVSVQAVRQWGVSPLVEPRNDSAPASSDAGAPNTRVRRFATAPWPCTRRVRS